MPGLSVLSAPVGGPTLAPTVAPAPANMPALSSSAPVIPFETPQSNAPLPVTNTPAVQPVLSPKVQTAPANQLNITSVGPTGNQQPFAAKLTLPQFGALIQAKYPIYAGKDPATIASAVLAKYPQYQSMVDMEPGQTPSTSSSTLPFSSGNPASDLLEGVAKSVLKLPVGVFELGEKLASAISGQGFNVQNDPNSLLGEIDNFLAPKTQVQKVGDVVGNIAALLVPAGQGEAGAAIASKVGDLLDLSTQGVKALQLLTTAGLTGAKDYALSEAQGQSNTSSAVVGGLGAAGELASPLVSALLKSPIAPTIQLAFPQGEQEAAQATWDMVKPVLSGNDLKAAVASGDIAPEGLLGKVMQVPDAQDLAMIKAAQPYVVPGDVLQTAKNLNQAFFDLDETATNGIAGQGGAWSASNLQGALNDIKVPLALKNTAEMTVVNNVQNYVMELAQATDESGNPLISRDASGADQLATEFRSSISKEYGENIWNKDTPQANYIKSVNRALNTFADSRLPEDFTLSNGQTPAEVRQTQSLLKQALTNVAAKAPEEGESTTKLGKAVEGVKGAVKGIAKTAMKFGPAGAIIKELPF